MAEAGGGDTDNSSEEKILAAVETEPAEIRADTETETASAETEAETDGSACRGRVDVKEEEEEATLHGEPNTFLLRLWERVKEGNSFSDVTLEFKGHQTLSSHSIVLVSLSPFFEAALTTDTTEKSSGVIHLPTTTLATFTLALAFTLGQEVKVGVECGLRELLELGEMLQLWELTKACGQVLAQRLSAQNCLETLRLVHKHQLEEVKEMVEDFVAGHLDTAGQEDTWSQLPEPEVSGVLQAAQRTSQNADLTTAALLTWLEKTSANSDTCSHMLSLIPVDGLTTEFMCRSLLFHPSVSLCPEFVNSIKNAIQLKFQSGKGPETGKSSLNTSSEGIQVEMQEGKKESESVDVPCPTALVFLGCDGSQSQVKKHMLVWLARQNVWVELHTPETLPYMCPILLDNDTLLVTSAHNTRPVQETNTTLYSFQTGTWKAARNLTYPRVFHGLAVVDKAVYAVGGHDGDSKSVMDIEAYYPSQRRWIIVGTLGLGVFDAGVASSGELVLTVGGRGDFNQNNVIQMFNTSTKIITITAAKLPVPMEFTRFAGVSSGGLYFLSGKGDLVRLEREQDKVRVDKHVQLENFPGRTGFAAFCESTGITVCGGGFHLQEYDYSGRKKQAASKIHSRSLNHAYFVPVFSTVLRHLSLTV